MFILTNFRFVYFTDHLEMEMKIGSPPPAGGRAAGQRQTQRGQGQGAPRAPRRRGRRGRGIALPDHQRVQELQQMHQARVDRDRVCIDFILTIIADSFLFKLFF